MTVVQDIAPVADTAPNFSEEAIALEFATRHADTLRYVAKWGKWFIWDGACWCEDTKRRVFTLARMLCREFARYPNKSHIRNKIASAKTRAAVVTLAGEDPRLVATVDQWDIDPWLLNTPGGVVDLRTGEIREHRASDYMTMITSATPTQTSDCPRWKKFMQEITLSNEAFQHYLQRVYGYALSGSTREQQLFFKYGSGNNGKGVLTLVVSFIFNNYHTGCSIETFTISKYDRHPTELAKLRGKRLVTASETEEGRRWAEARIKELTGGDQIAARFMRQDEFLFYPQFKLDFSGNHMPPLRVVNKAITRRFNRIPFDLKLTADQINQNLAEELKQEAPGILAWLIEGCLDWQKNGLSPPQVVIEATEKYLESQDVIGEWMEDCWERDSEGFVGATEAFLAWKPWAEERQEYVGSRTLLSGKLEDRGLRKGRNKEQTQTGFLGWKLKQPQPQAQAQTKMLWMYVQHETPGGNGKDHDGAVLVTLHSEDRGGVWLPKSQIKMSEPDEDNRVEITMPMWLAKAKGLDLLESVVPPGEIPF